MLLALGTYCYQALFAENPIFYLMLIIEMVYEFKKSHLLERVAICWGLVMYSFGSIPKESENGFDIFLPHKNSVITFDFWL